MDPTAAPVDRTGECFPTSPTTLATKLHPPNLSVVLLLKTDFTIFQGNCDMLQISGLPEATVELGDGERYFYYSQDLQLHPKQLAGIAVPWDTVLGMFPLEKPSHVQSGHK